MAAAATSNDTGRLVVSLGPGKSDDDADFPIDDSDDDDEGEGDPGSAADADHGGQASAGEPQQGANGNGADPAPQHIPYPRFQQVLTERNGLRERLTSSERALIEAQARAKVLEEMMLRGGQSAPAQQPQQTVADQIQALETEIATLDEQYDRAEISDADHRKRTRELERALNRLETKQAQESAAPQQQQQPAARGRPMESAALKAATADLVAANKHWLDKFQEMIDEDTFKTLSDLAAREVAQLGFDPDSEDADFETRRIAIDHAREMARRWGLQVDAPTANASNPQQRQHPVSPALQQHRQKAAMAAGHPPNLAAAGRQRGGDGSYTEADILAMDPDKLPAEWLKSRDDE